MGEAIILTYANILSEDLIENEAKIRSACYFVQLSSFSSELNLAFILIHPLITRTHHRALKYIQWFRRLLGHFLPLVQEAVTQPRCLQCFNLSLENALRYTLIDNKRGAEGR